MVKFREYGRDGQPIKQGYREYDRTGNYINPNITGYDRTGRPEYGTNRVPRNQDGSSAIPKEYGMHGELISKNGTFTDRTLICADCKQEFTWSAGEQDFFAQKGLKEPRRCKDCKRR